MNEDTPLSEVSTHLGDFATDILARCEPVVREATLEILREVIVYWEGQRQVFDPVAFERVLDALVSAVVPLAMDVRAAAAEIHYLRSRLTGADLLIQAMSQTISDLTAVGAEDLGETRT